jgi:DNA-binding NarL/FixJ family response regulator
MTAVPHSVLALVPDLIFAARIRAAAQDTGVPCRVVGSLAAIQKAAAEEPPAILILDLDTVDPAPAIAAARMARPTVRTVAFVSHVRADLAAAARAAGVDVVLARSAFVRQLPGLLQVASG